MDGEKIDRMPIYPERFLLRLHCSSLGCRMYTCTTTAVLFVYSRKEFIQDIPLYGEMHRFIPIHVTWAGARLVEVPVKHHLRTRGESKYGLENSKSIGFNHLKISTGFLCHTDLLFRLVRIGFVLLGVLLMTISAELGGKEYTQNHWSSSRRLVLVMWTRLG